MKRYFGIVAAIASSLTLVACEGDGHHVSRTLALAGYVTGAGGGRGGGPCFSFSSECVGPHGFGPSAPILSKYAAGQYGLNLESADQVSMAIHTLAETGSTEGFNQLGFSDADLAKIAKEGVITESSKAAFQSLGLDDLAQEIVVQNVFELSQLAKD